jgi:hypothetical protein
MNRFVARARLPVSAEEAFAWHARPGAFERLSPPWSPVKVVHRSAAGIGEGTRLEIEARLGPVPVRWVAEHGPVEPGRSFEDVQISGPFAHWRHRHRFLPDGPDACTLEDDIEYALPLGPLGSLLGGAVARRSIERLFARRHAVTRGDLERHAAVRGQTLEVAITGATGLVGRALGAFLTAGGHRVKRVVRSAAAPGDVAWDPGRGSIDADGLEGLDAVVHLAGENIAAGRWTEARKRAIRDSRVGSTRLLAEALARLSRPPAVLICASAVGYYGNRGSEAVDETSAPGEGFLTETCIAWESAAGPAAERGIRVAHVRFGTVLSAEGGALAKLVPPFLLGAGGPLGSGRQGMSWVALDDAIGIVHFLLHRDDLAGAFNATAPDAVPQREFARTLGRVLRRPAIAPLPSPVVRAIFGKMGERLLLEGAFVKPRKLLEAGFRFRHPGLEEALRFELGRASAGQPG